MALAACYLQSSSIFGIPRIAVKVRSSHPRFMSVPIVLNLRWTCYRNFLNLFFDFSEAGDTRQCDLYHPHRTPTRIQFLNVRISLGKLLSKQHPYSQIDTTFFRRRCSNLIFWCLWIDMTWHGTLFLQSYLWNGSTQHIAFWKMHFCHCVSQM